MAVATMEQEQATMEANMLGIITTTEPVGLGQGVLVLPTN
jgi:hypothetical protein